MLASMSKHEAQEHFIVLMLKELKKGKSTNEEDNMKHPTGKKKGKQKQSSPSDHYTIAESEWIPTDIMAWLGSLQDDWATKVRDTTIWLSTNNAHLGLYW